jgi:hypothetical protein
MSDFPRTPPASHPRSIPDGRFPMYADEEMASPPMCGQGILTKLLRKSPGRQTPVDDNGNESKSCLKPAKQLTLLRTTRYEEVAGGLYSPDTQSSYSSESKEDGTQLAQKATGVAPPYFVQFDPKEAEEVMGEHPSEPPTMNRAKQRSVGHNFRQPSWSTSLPVVTEENSTDSDDLRDEEMRAKSRSASSYQDSTKFSDDPTSQSALTSLSPQEKNDMLIGMRHLVLKQQMKLAELSEQDAQYRREIRSYQHTLLAMKEEQMTQRDKIGLLTIEKETFEAEVVWLREKVKAPQPGPESPVYEDSLTRQFQRLMTDQPDQKYRQTDGQKEEDEDLDFHEFEKGLMSDNFCGNILGEDKDSSSRTVGQMGHIRDEMTSQRACDSSRAPPAREEREGHTTTSQRACDSSRALPVREEREAIHSTGSSETRSSAHTDSSKEEVALFKSRLDTIQQKRRHRQRGRNSTSATRNVVRFDHGL